MTWQEVRQHFPEQWLLVEATQAHTEQGYRILDTLSVMGTFDDGTAAWKEYARLHKQFPQREMFPLHTSVERLEIEVRPWHGIRV